MKKILVFLLVPIFLFGGLAAGFMLKPAPDITETESEDRADEDAIVEKEINDLTAEGEPPAEPPKEDKTLVGEPPAVDYVKLEKQFVVPLVEQDRVESLMIITMALETDQGATELVFAHEPKLRDQFLQVLFTHAQSGGFDGSFTDLRSMDDLRLALNQSARSVLGDVIRSVLLTNMIRQDF